MWNVPYTMKCGISRILGLSQREICAHFNEGNLAQFGRSAEKLKIVDLRSEI